MFKKLAALAGVVAVVPGGCDPRIVCDYLDVICEYVPAEVCEALTWLCELPVPM